MHLGILLFGMMIAILVGKSGKKFGTREYMIAILLAILQTAITMQKMFTMEMPPLF